MPDFSEELHLRRIEWIVFGELELGREDATFKRSLFWALDQCLPDKEVILTDGTGSDSIGRIRKESLVL